VEEFQATLEGWVHELKPADSYERELVYNMVCASIALTRVRKADNAAVGARVQAAGDLWDATRADGLRSLTEALQANTMAAHDALLRRGDGCRWLIARWRQLDATLAGGGYWHHQRCDEALRLLGVDPGSRDAAVARVHGLGLGLEARLGVNVLSDEALASMYGVAVIHDPDPAAALRAIVADELEALESLAPAPEAAEAADRESAIATSYVDTTDDGMRRHRYLQDHLRNLRQFAASLIASKKARQSPRSRGADLPAPAPRPVPPRAEAPARNEPKNDATRLPESSSDANPVPVASRLVSKLFAGWAPRPATALPGVV
ncbi:MAG TPA: hypothetical protein VG406_08065, partial [Isosphaeraceae bacterium]|nr:hypothetical protein [Isosphaeraceae bacterium]